MSRSKGYVDSRYLQAAAELLQPLKQHSYRLMRVSEGATVLDVGCGTGIDTIALASLVGPRGRVLGIDSDAGMVVDADERAKQQKVEAFVEHRRGAATALPVQSETVDACRCERVFMHLPVPDAESALREMIRVTKTGGWIVAIEPDWGTSSIDNDEFDIERRLARARAELMMHNGYAGRQLYRLFKRSGLVSISVKIFPIYLTDCALSRYIDRLDAVEQGAIDAGIATAEELQRWHASLEKADKEGVFFSCTCIMMLSGCKL